jgi:hypothetical protein
MAFWGEGDVGGGWQGLMGRKKRPWQSNVMPPAAKRSMIGGTTAALGKKGPNWEEISEVMAEMQIMEGEVIPGGKYGRAEEYAALPFDQTPEQKKKREERQSMFRFLA